jgi:hypothetical protein
MEICPRVHNCECYQKPLLQLWSLSGGPNSEAQVSLSDKKGSQDLRRFIKLSSHPGKNHGMNTVAGGLSEGKQQSSEPLEGEKLAAPS